MKKKHSQTIIAFITGSNYDNSIFSVTYAETTTQSIKKNISDSYITSKVKSKLALNNVTKARNIHVITEKGIVHLSGSLDSGNEALVAVQVAASVDGVRDVNSSEITIPNSLIPTDDLYLASKLKGFLLREKLFNDFSTPEVNIEVSSINGEITLSGKVNSIDQKNKAMKLL